MILCKFKPCVFSNILQSHVLNFVEPCPQFCRAMYSILQSHVLNSVESCPQFCRFMSSIPQSHVLKFVEPCLQFCRAMSSILQRHVLNSLEPCPQFPKYRLRFKNFVETYRFAILQRHIASQFSKAYPYCNKIFG